MGLKKNLLSDLAIALVLLSVVILSSYFGVKPLETVEIYFYDLLRPLKSPSPSSGQVVVIGIDDHGIEQTDQWPLQRSLIAEAVNKIESLGARVVALDILYSEKDRNPGLSEIRKLLKALKEDPLQVLKEKEVIDLFSYLKMSKSEQRRYSDALLNASVAESQKILVALLSDTEKRIDFDSLFIQKISGSKNLLMPLEFYFDRKDKAYDMPSFMLQNSIPYRCKGNLVEAQAVASPLESFAVKAYGLGHINIKPDPDGILRRHQLFICYRERLFPSLALQSIIKLQRTSVEKVYHQYLNDNPGLGRGTEVFIDYDLTKGLTYYSFAELLSGSIAMDKVRDKIVVIGVNNPRYAETFKISRMQEVSSIFVHGAVIQGLLSNSYSSRPEKAFVYELVFLLFLALMMLIARRRHMTLLITTLVMPALWTLFCAYMLIYQGIILKVSYPWTLALLLFVVFFIKGRIEAQEGLEGKAMDLLETQDLRFVIGAKSDIGKVRERNEDSFCIDKSLGILAVADGVGGHASGEIASKMALDVMRDFIRDKTHGSSHPSHPASEIIREAIEAANQEVLRSASENPKLKGMATTLTAAYIKNNRLIIGHVGDSRIYLIRGGQLEQLSEDHTVATEKGLRSISPKEAEMMRHVLTRAIGIQSKVEVDTYEMNITKGDTLLLCTDGLYSMVSERDIDSIVRSYRDPEKACSALVQEANRRGGHDNITVILAHVRSKD